MLGEPAVDLLRRSEEESIVVDARRDALVVADPTDAAVDTTVGRTHPREPVDTELADEAAQSVRESTALTEGDPPDHATVRLETRRRLPHARQDQHPLVRVIAPFDEGRPCLDEEERVDVVIGIRRMIGEQLGAEDQCGLHDALASLTG